MSELFYHSRTVPRVTIAAVIDGQRVKFGAARCGTNDQFNKKLGRQIALGRARKSPYGIQTLPPENFSKWFHSIAGEIIREVQADARLLTSKS